MYSHLPDYTADNFHDVPLIKMAPFIGKYSGNTSILSTNALESANASSDWWE